jgi:hypothetical protein
VPTRWGPTGFGSARDSFVSDKPPVAPAVPRHPAPMRLLRRRTMRELKREFLPGIEYNAVYNPTAFIANSIGHVKTIYEAPGRRRYFVSWRAGTIAAFKLWARRLSIALS